MKYYLSAIICLVCFTSSAQTESFDLTSYTSPKGWTKETKENIVAYTITDKKNNTWCQVQVVKSTASKGGIEQDFASEWQDLIVAPYKVKDTPKIHEEQEAEGWKVKGGGGKFSFNNKDAMAMLTTMSGYNRCVSVIVITNTLDYVPQIDSFMASVTLARPNTVADNVAGESSTAIDKPEISTTPGSFAFSTTNFDDGWTSVVKEDWVEVSKGAIKVLLHFPKEGTVFPADPEPLTTAAWNILVAPRYSNLKNYRTAYISTYNRPSLGMGYATENSTGKNAFVLLFRQGEGWIEFVAPDKNTFIQQFKFDPETVKWDTNSDLVNPLANMIVYNKFAIAESDFKGKWTSDFTGIQQLYNVYTGDYAGMHMNQSNEEFIFGAGNTYSWKLLVVNGMAGNAKYNQVKSSGKLTVPNNWQIQCSKIESGSKLYNAFWSCIKGARVLNLLDAHRPGSGIYTKYGLAK